MKQKTFAIEPQTALPPQRLSRCFQIRGTDADDLDQLQLSALFSYMQETAYHHAEALGLGASYLDERRLCWILRQVTARFDFLPHWGQKVEVTTWQRGVERLAFWRDFHLRDESGRPFAAATSQWLLASHEGHRPQRPDRALPHEKVPPLQPEVFSLPQVRLVDLSRQQPLLTRTALYSDIDRNQHVNNTRYVAWAMDALVTWQKQSGISRQKALQPREIQIQYVSEVRLGQAVEFHIDAENDPIRIDAVDEASQKTVFRARLERGG